MPSRHITGLGALLLVCIASVSIAADAASEIKEGDTALVAKDGVKLMVGNTSIADLPKETRLKITKVNGDWIGGTVDIQGVQKTGWVKKDEIKIAPPAAAAPAAKPAVGGEYGPVVG